MYLCMFPCLKMPPLGVVYGNFMGVVYEDFMGVALIWRCSDSGGTDSLRCPGTGGYSMWAE